MIPSPVTGLLSDFFQNYFQQEPLFSSLVYFQFVSGEYPPCKAFRKPGVLTSCTTHPRRNLVHKNKTNLKQGAHKHQPTAWPVPHACAEPYHPGSSRVGVCVPLAISLSYKNKTIKFDVVGERPATIHIQIGCLQNKRVEKLHRLKSQPMFSDASQTVACVAWQFWLLTNKGGRGQRNREGIGAGGQLVFIFLAEWGEPFDFPTGISGFPM